VSRGNTSPERERRAGATPSERGTLARAGAEGGHVQHRDEDDPAEHLVGPDLAQQLLEDDRPLDLVAVVGAERHQAAAGLDVRADEDREGDQVVAPDAIVLERHPVVAPAGGVEIELRRPDDHARHRPIPRWEDGGTGSPA